VMLPGSHVRGFFFQSTGVLVGSPSDYNYRQPPPEKKT
jgi:hypothetical protein